MISASVQDNLDIYAKLLRKWQARINLISTSTLADLERRHIHDSLQLMPYIPEKTKHLVDLGSGAGFPGLVIAIARPDIEVSLIEADQKKCSFLKAVSRETNANVSVLNQRIEDVIFDRHIDIVTARALADLNQLITYCLPFIESNPDLELIFLKGEKADAEIKAAQENFKFHVKHISSRTNLDAKILLIRNVLPRN